MQFLYEIGGEHEEKLVRIQEALIEDESLENLVFSCVHEDLKLTMIVDDMPQGCQVLIITLESARRGSDEEHVALVSFPAKQWKNWGSFELLDTTVYKFADQEGFLPNVEWFNKRNERLRIKVDNPGGVASAPPGSLRELIVSYLLSERGMVCIEKAGRTKCGLPAAAMLHLRSMPEDSNETIAEDVMVSLERLRTMIEKRKALNRQKRELTPDYYQ